LMFAIAARMHKAFEGVAPLERSWEWQSGFLGSNYWSSPSFVDADWSPQYAIRYALGLQVNPAVWRPQNPSTWRYGSRAGHHPFFVLYIKVEPVTKCDGRTESQHELVLAAALDMGEHCYSVSFRLTKPRVVWLADPQVLLDSRDLVLKSIAPFPKDMTLRGGVFPDYYDDRSFNYYPRRILAEPP
jgi:hypothetical protein